MLREKLNLQSLAAQGIAGFLYTIRKPAAIRLPVFIWCVSFDGGEDLFAVGAVEGLNMKAVEKSVPEVLAQLDLPLTHRLVTHLLVLAPADLLGTFDITRRHCFSAARTNHVKYLLLV